MQCEYLSLRGLVQLEGTVSMIRENLNPSVEIRGILPTMFDSRTLHAREAIEMLKENFGDLVFETRIKKTIRYAEAPVAGLLRPQVRAERARPPRPTATLRRRCSMARNRARASMREGPLAELFKATEAAQRQAEKEAAEGGGRRRADRRARRARARRVHDDRGGRGPRGAGGCAGRAGCCTERSGGRACIVRGARSRSPVEMPPAARWTDAAPARARRAPSPPPTSRSSASSASAAAA